MDIIFSILFGFFILFFLSSLNEISKKSSNAFIYIFITSILGSILFEVILFALS
ncbi:MAG: hypothetical protein ACERKV_13190 [Clostridiaceae bacterium]